MDPVSSETHNNHSRAWVLNLDAELELMQPASYQPTHKSLAACARFSPFAANLIRPQDIQVSRAEPVASAYARGYVGTAWCPTPSVLRLLEQAGAPVEDAPTLMCLQGVNHRSFHAALGQTLPDATFVSLADQVQRKLSSNSPEGWLVKRGFGFAGRGLRRFPNTPSADDGRWLSDALRYGGVQVEPWVPIIAEFSLHGYVSRTAPLRIGTVCVRLPGPDPVYSTVPEVITPTQAPADLDVTLTLSEVERHALFSETTRVADALRAEGYCGPFGVDAFTFWWNGRREFNPRSEINARYTLAYATGMNAFPTSNRMPPDPTHHS